GNIYFVDFDSSRIREIVKATGQIITVAGNGTAGFSGDGGPATSAQLKFPQGLAIDSAGNLYIGDLQNHRVREVVKATGNIITIAANGTAGFSGDGGLATSAALSSHVQHVSVDSAGNVYIADQGNHRIREVVKATGNIIT